MLHTMVPDHWAPIALIARARGWSRKETIRSAAIAGFGHTVSTLLIGLIAFLAGSLAARRFGHAVNIVASIALIAFGLWTLASSLHELRRTVVVEGEAQVIPRKASFRTTLLLIVGSSPSLEALPAFVAAVPFGALGLSVMALVFAATTIGTYVVFCAASTAGLDRLKFPAIERYGEVISGAFVMLIGVVFLLWFR